jgi:hypothetical protein
MLDVKIPDEARSWDRYNAFHCAVHMNAFHRTSSYQASPIILFDTGELIVTTSCPSPWMRGHYPLVGISLTTSKDVKLYLPDGTPCTMAWLDDYGMQYLLVDHETKQAVRFSTYRYDGKKLTPGIPTRFQMSATAYIPGPGMAPVSPAKVKVSRPLNKAGFDAHELEHIRMIVATGQAAMKLADHPAVQAQVKKSADPDVLLKCKTWLDVPNSMLPALAGGGCTRRTQLFDYLLTSAE